jgi:MFS family permease
MVMSVRAEVAPQILETAGPVPAEPHLASRWVIYLLTLVYVFNMLDRQIITILVEPMKQDLKLADWQIGAVSGLAFALLYTTAGIPLARIADKGNRVWMIATSLAVWSTFTMLCGAARNFGEMLAARIGVGVGEAGCTPAAHSFISDYVPPERRASALATYSLGTPLGALAGLGAGGILLTALGWRWVFVLAGLPGIALAVFVVMVLRDPRHDALKRLGQTAAPALLPLGVVLRTLRRKRSFWCVSFASATAGFGYFGQTAFMGSLYLRTHSVVLNQLAADYGMQPASFLGLMLAVLVGVCGSVGTIVGGVIADRAFRFGIIAYPRIGMMSLFCCMPFLACAAMVDNMLLSFALFGGGFTIFAFSYASAYSAVQTLAGPRMRAMASAIQIFIINAIGLAFGPLFTGALSDLLTPVLGPSANLRAAMAVTTAAYLISAFLFWLAARTIVEDEKI